MSAETVIAGIALLVSAGGLWIAILAYLHAKGAEQRAQTAADRAHRLAFRSELQEIRSSWEREIAPALMGHTGVLTNDEQLLLIRLMNAAAVVSEEVHAAMSRVNTLSADLTAIHETTGGASSVLAEAARTKSQKFRELQVAEDDVFRLIAEELKAQL